MKKATRYSVVKKYAGTNKKPSSKELNEAYGYLDYCYGCGEKITAFEPYSHGFEGNSHKFGCKAYQRIFGVIINLPAKIILTVWAFLMIPFIIIYLGTKEFLKELR